MVFRQGSVTVWVPIERSAAAVTFAYISVTAVHGTQPAVYESWANAKKGKENVPFIRLDRDKLCKSSTQMQGGVRGAHSHTTFADTKKCQHEWRATINHVIVFVYIRRRLGLGTMPSTRFNVNLSIVTNGAGIDSTTIKSTVSCHRCWAYVAVSLTWKIALIMCNNNGNLVGDYN